MNVVEKVKGLAKARGIPIYILERECGFSNGYIGQLKKGTMPMERVQKVAEYFELPLSYFTGEKDKGTEMYYLDPEAAEIAQELFERPELKVLFKASRKVSAEDIKVVQNMVDALARKDDE